MKADHQRIIQLLGLLIVFSPCTGNARVAAEAVPVSADVPVSLAPLQAGSFGDALKTLVGQAHVAFVTEGTPLQKSLFGTAVPRLTPGAPLSTTVGKIADAYDYMAERQGNIFILKKRYTRPNDLPDVTPEECAQSLEDMYHILEAFDPGQSEMWPDRQYPMITALVESLTPAELLALQQTRVENALPISVLNEPQQAAVRTFTLNSYVSEPANNVSNVLERIRQTSQISLCVKKETVQNTVTTDMGDGPTTQVYTRNNALGYRFRDAYGRADFVPFEANARMPDAMLDDYSKPEDASAAPRAGVSGETTIQAVVASLAARGLPVSVDAALRAKTVTAYGLETVPPNDVLQALADVYGLRVKKEPGKPQKLTRPLYSIPSDITGLPDAVRQALPAPLLRMMHDGELEALNRKNTPPAVPTDAATRAWQDQEAQSWRLSLRIRRLPQTITQIGADRLQAAVEVTLAKKGMSVKQDLARGQFSEPVPLDALPSSARSAFAAVMMTSVLDDVIHTLGRQAPDYAAHLEQCYLTGSLTQDPDHPGRRLITIGVSVAQADGTLAGRGPAIFGAAYDR